MAHAVFLKPSAERDLDALPKRDFVRVKARILALAQDPRPRGAQKLNGGENLYRVRSGVYRILYEVQDDRLVVLVVRVGHRRDVYR